MATVGVVGVGSIGTVLAKGFDQLGHDVHINDTDTEALDQLPYPPASKRQLASQCEYIVIALPTPTTEDGGDASIIDTALADLNHTDATVIIRSTMPPGSTRRLADKHDLPLVYSPEFLRDRSGVDDFFYPDRIVLAGPARERQAARTLFDDPQVQCDTIIQTTQYIDAEIAKEAHNAFFATKVSFANQMRLICEQADADPEFCMDVVTADHRNTTSHLDPMLGPYGGKCLPKDTEALRTYANQDVDAPTPLLDGTVWMNDLAKDNYDNISIEGTWPDITVTSD